MNEKKEERYTLSDGEVLEIYDSNREMNVKLKRIIYTNGLKGGWIESEANLPKSSTARVLDNAKVFGTVKLTDRAEVCGDAMVFSNVPDAKIMGKVVVTGNAVLKNVKSITAQSIGTVMIKDRASLRNVVINTVGNVLIGGNVRLTHTNIEGSVTIGGEVNLIGEMYLHGIISNPLTIDGEVTLDCDGLGIYGGEFSSNLDFVIIPCFIDSLLIPKKQKNILYSVYDKTYHFLNGKYTKGQLIDLLSNTKELNTMTSFIDSLLVNEVIRSSDNRKYRLSSESRLAPDNVTKLYRIEYLGDFKNERCGGWLENYSNLSQDGDCGVYDNAMVYGSGSVVEGNATIFDNVIVSEGSKVVDDATISGDTKLVKGSKVGGYTTVMGVIPNNLKKDKLVDDAIVIVNSTIMGSVEIIYEFHKRKDSENKDISVLGIFDSEIINDSDCEHIRLCGCGEIFQSVMNGCIDINNSNFHIDRANIIGPEDSYIRVNGHLILNEGSSLRGAMTIIGNLELCKRAMLNSGDRVISTKGDFVIGDDVKLFGKFELSNDNKCETIKSSDDIRTFTISSITLTAYKPAETQGLVWVHGVLRFEDITELVKLYSLSSNEVNIHLLKFISDLMSKKN